MQIQKKTWIKYIAALAKVDRGASAQMAEYIRKKGMNLSDTTGRADLIKAAYAISGKFGEAAAALTCEMYDSIAAASMVHVPSAVPAETPTYAEVAKTVNGTAKTGNFDIVAQSVGRLVKRVGVDTMMQNALRDGAEWAWIPNGDTCAFCLTLASRGWQRASKKALKNGHAEHIHANCDCTYAVRFDSSTEVEGYNPNTYKRIYDNAEGDNWKEKLNSMRREQYALSNQAYNTENDNNMII
jgi:hypothetical protein